MAGAFPAFESDAATESVLRKILELGVDTFVCLQAEFSLATPEEVWRQGRGLRPYGECVKVEHKEARGDIARSSWPFESLIS